MSFRLAGSKRPRDAARSSNDRGKDIYDSPSRDEIPKAIVARIKWVRYLVPHEMSYPRCASHADCALSPAVLHAEIKKDSPRATTHRRMKDRTPQQASRKLVAEFLPFPFQERRKHTGTHQLPWPVHYAHGQLGQKKQKRRVISLHLTISSSFFFAEGFVATADEAAPEPAAPAASPSAPPFCSRMNFEKGSSF